MKKTLLTVLVLMLVAPAIAFAGVTIRLEEDLTASRDPNQWVAVKYVADANVRAFALKIEVAGGANIIDINNYFEGDCNTPSRKGFGIFLDQVQGIDVGGDGVVNDWGSPIADACAPGAAGSGLNTNTIIIGMGALYEDGNQPPLSGKLCDLLIGPVPDSYQGRSPVTVTVSREVTYRGGVVLEDGNSVTRLETKGTGINPLTLWDCNDEVSNPYFALTARCDITDDSVVGPPDGDVDWRDLSALLYFWDHNDYGPGSPNCTDWGAYEALCIRSDITDDTVVGPPDGDVDWRDLSALLYFWNLNVCN